MAKNNNLTDFMVSVANAIRTKKGTSGAINPQNFDSEILSIESMPTSTKELAKTISGEVATDETTLNNAIAKGATDTPETATFAERTTADGGTIKDTIARIDKVKGNCVKFNQLLNPSTYPTSRTVQGVTYKGNGDGSITITGTATATSAVAGISGNFTLLSGHKYIFGAYGCYNTARVRLFGVTMGNKNLVNNLDYAVVDGNGTDYNLAFIYTSGVTYNVTLIPFVIDLTAIGREDITTGDGLAQLYGFANLASMPYLGYQSETIVLTNSKNSVTSKSRNLLTPSSWEIGKSYNGQVVLKRAYFFLNVPRGTYTISIQNFVGVSEITCGLQYAKYGERTSPSALNATTKSVAKTTDGTNGLQMLVIASGDTMTQEIIDNLKVQIEEGSTAHDFCPYFAPDNLPTNARNLTDSEGSTIFPNGLCSVGDIHDEWDMAKGVAVKRVGVVNMGTLSWAKNTYNNILSFRVATANLPIAPTQGSAYLPNVLCCRYTTYKWNEAYSGVDMSLSQMSNAIVVQDSGYTDAATFKTAMSGVYLYYELAEPITYNVSKAKAYYKVSQNGKEIANSTELSAPFKADIAYRGMSAEELINELNG